MIEAIEDIDDGASEETFVREIMEIIPEMDWEYIEIIKEYPIGAITVVNLFINYLQPRIKEEFGK